MRRVGAPADPRARRLRIALGVLLALTLAAVFETRQSVLQSWLLSKVAPRASFEIGAGRSPTIVFPPADAPYDRRLGYSEIPVFERILSSRGYTVREQSRFSPFLLRLARWGVPPPYPEATATGLVLSGTGGEPIFDSRPEGQAFRSFDQIPPIVVRSLLFIENRELESGAPRKNPVVEWDRLGRAAITYAASRLGLPLHVQGGSALATQIEKYRHSPEGRTGSAAEKLRQMAGATLKVYREGPDTQLERRRIVLEYLNSIPLSAVPGYGEVHGIGEGLQAWFGKSLDDVISDLDEHRPAAERARAFKHVLALLCAVRAPTEFLVRDPGLLEERADYFTGRLLTAGIIDPDFARRVRETPLLSPKRSAPPPAARRAANKAVDAARAHLQRLLGLESLYDLDRLHLEATTTLDVELQREAEKLLRSLGDPRFVTEHGLRGERLLSSGSPEEVLYSVLVFESTARGNELRIQADNLDQPLDLNEGMKLELGSTAKLRVVAHYLALAERLHHDLQGAEPRTLASRRLLTRDPMTEWAVETIGREPGIGLRAFLEAALERTYSASPGETFFTGGGAHTFRNFDPKDNGRRPTVREALVQSTNLVFIRLMRDLVRYHEARLPYDAKAVLANQDDAVRRRMLEEIAEDEARLALSRAYRKYRGLTLDGSVQAMLGRRARSPRHLAMLFYAWNPGGREEALGRWLADRGLVLEPREVERLVRGYGSPLLTLPDFGYLLGEHTLEVWCAGQLVRNPGLPWDELLARSGNAREQANAWLFRPRNRRAQDLRLRIRFEKDAFERMTPEWRRLGFPFERLVPSYATAIGSSCDRPAALADLMGILVNDGVRRRAVRIGELRFAEGTPYHTVLETVPDAGERVLSPEIAGVLRSALADVVERGTARRAAGAVTFPGGAKAIVGGKTGSGDNRFETFARGGRVISSRVMNRTATFVFYVEDRYFGVITAFVPGDGAEDYRFTSALPVSVFKLLAPALDRRLGTAAPATLQELPGPVVSLPEDGSGLLTQAFAR